MARSRHMTLGHAKSLSSWKQARGSRIRDETGACPLHRKFTALGTKSAPELTFDPISIRELKGLKPFCSKWPCAQQFSTYGLALLGCYLRSRVTGSTRILRWELVHCYQGCAKNVIALFESNSY